MFLNPTVSDEEIAFYLADSRAKGVVTTKAIADRLPKDRPYLRAVLAVDDVVDVDTFVDLCERRCSLDPFKSGFCFFRVGFHLFEGV